MLHDISYSLLKTMKVFKAELLMCNPARVKVATERDNQSFMIQRGSILKAGIYATDEVVFIFWWNAGVVRLSDLELPYL